MFDHLNECIGVEHMLEIGKLTPSLLTNNIIDEFDLRSSRANLVQMNIEIIKIKETKPTLNTGLKASKELQLP